MFHTKPLELIWKLYDSYSHTNTVIVDDKERNIEMNPKNGILIKPFDTWKDGFEDDRELFHLSRYLQRLCSREDLSLCDHSSWRPQPNRAESLGYFDPPINPKYM